MRQEQSEQVSLADRRRSALAKTRLLARGIQDDARLFSSLGQFKEDNYAYDNGNWGVGRSRAVPSDVELPGGIVVKLHIRPSWPLRLVRQGTQPLVVEGHNELSECRLLPRPKFWNLPTRSGLPAHKLLQFCVATCLNLNIFSGCQFLSVDKACQFCSVQSTQILHHAVVVRKVPADLRDACQLAVLNDRVEWYLQTGGSHLNSDEEFDSHLAVLREVRPVLPWGGRFRGNVALMPPRDLGRLQELYDLGVEHRSFNLEVWPQDAFEQFCPGKAQFVGFDHILRAMDYLVSLYRLGWGWCNFVAGLVPLDIQKQRFTALAERGIVPEANVFRTDVGATLGQTMNSPSENCIVELYNHAAELYHRYGYKPFFDARVLRNSLTNEVYERLLAQRYGLADE
jgi:hypothetical protein